MTDPTVSTAYWGRMASVGPTPAIVFPSYEEDYADDDPFRGQPPPPQRTRRRHHCPPPCRTAGLGGLTFWTFALVVGGLTYQIVV